MTGAWTGHGGRLAHARAVFGDGEAPWLDLSTGINPHPWPGTSGLAIDWRHLPDEASLHALEIAAAAYLGVDQDHVVALPGTEIGLRLLGYLLPGAASHVWPSYRTHADMFANSMPVSAGRMLDAPDGVLVLANPNNPDGRILPAETLLDLLQHRRSNGGWLLVDEAFADAAPRSGIAAHVGDDAPLVVLRSFGKFFGLAGVRLGFMIGPRSLVARLRAMLGAWPISAAAIAIGTAAYRDDRWIAAMRQQLAAEAEAVDAVLRGRGLAPIGHCPLFRLVEVGDAAALFRRLAARAILARPFAYDPRWLRLGLPGSEAGLARLDRALADG